MRYWFTSWPGTDWTPEKGYNDLFAQQVHAIRKRFCLGKSETLGIELGIGIRAYYDIPYPPNQNKVHERVLVSVRQFSWKGWEGRAENISPVFVLLMVIYLPSGTEIFKGIITLHFPCNYPVGRPTIFVRVDSFKGGCVTYVRGESKEGYKLCVMNGRSDWDPTRDNVLRAIEVAIAWALTNYRQGYG
ncbi:MAG: hypothetical protein Q7S03_03375 [bacterium]|nr:hypothetical protein [bacterium]